MITFCLVCSVVPVVEVTATRTGVLIGDMVTLTCSVINGNPSYVTYSWRFMNTNITTSNILTLTIENVNDFGNYICEATNLAGSGNGTVSIAQGGKYH